MRSILPGLAAVALVACAIASCGGRTLVGSSEGGSTDDGGRGGLTGSFGATGTIGSTGVAGTTGSYTSGTTGFASTTGFPGEDGGDGPDSSMGSTGGCVYINPAAFDRYCIQDSDCLSVTVGQICTGQCLCGGGAISSSEGPRYNAAVASIGAVDDCPCVYEGPVVCVEGQCTQCPASGSAEQPGCPDNDGGIFVSSDGGSATDSGVCVDIDLSTYDQSCTQDSDCFVVTSGEICSGECALEGGSAVNVSGRQRYLAAVAPIEVADESLPFTCAYPAWTTVCAAGQCSVCTGGAVDGGCINLPK